MIEKACRTCNVIKPLNEYYSCKNCPDGRRYVCKQCDKEKVKSYRKRNPEKYKQAVKKYHAENREVRNAANKKYREDNREYESDRMKIWRLENKEHIRKYIVKYRENNLEKLKEQEARWRANNKEKINIAQSRRRARKRMLPNEFTSEQLAELLKHFNDGCALTGSKEDINVDHVIPLATGHGGTTYGNMIPLRGDLNRSKHDANIFEWFESNRQRFELSEENFSKMIDYLAEINGVTAEEYRDHVFWCHENKQFFDDEREGI